MTEESSNVDTATIDAESEVEAAFIDAADDESANHEADAADGADNVLPFTTVPPNWECDRQGRPLPSQGNIRLALQRLGVRVTFDEFKCRLLIDGLEDHGPLLDDAAMTRLWLEIEIKFHFRAKKEFFFDVVNDAARRNGFHPVLDYLDGLKWDGKKRIDKLFSTYGGAASTAYLDAVGATMLIAAVRRVRQPGCKFDEMVVLESPQGMNKSSALAIMAVNEDWFTDNLPLGADAKLQREAITGFWIVEAAELSGMRKGEIEHLKASLSRRVDRARMSYDRFASEAPRQCIIVGTTNAKEYLRDSTGNRRFWPVKVQRFDLDALARDRDQLWAEAAAREADGCSIRLDESLWAAAGRAQEARRVAHPWEDVIEKYLGDKEGKIKSIDVWRLVERHQGQRSQEDNVKLGEAMRKKGWESTRARDGGGKVAAYAKGDGLRWIDIVPPAAEAPDRDFIVTVRPFKDDLM